MTHERERENGESGEGKELHDCHLLSRSLILSLSATGSMSH